MYLGKVNKFAPFEKKLIALVKNVEFRKVKNHFLKKFQSAIKTIITSGKAITFADKINHMYRLSTDQYNIILNNSITSKYVYKKSNIKVNKKINIAEKTF